MPFLLRFLLFGGIALVFGLGSARQTVSQGFFATTTYYGPWALWMHEGTADADPYTIAHNMRLGTLPITSANAMTFTATRDGAGAPLSGNCTYDVKGYAIPALWWSLAAFGPGGAVMPNKTGRSSFNSANVATAPDGSFLVRLSPEVQPGNWLPVERGERVSLRLEVLRPLAPDSLLKSGEDLLPAITLVECGS